jgi:hypothetical protein
MDSSRKNLIWDRLSSVAELHKKVRDDYADNYLVGDRQTDRHFRQVLPGDDASSPDLY